MFYNYYQSNEYQYDSCVAKGICSIDPTISSLQEVIVMYLKQLAFYILKLEALGVTNDKIKHDIIDTLSGLVSNTDYSQEQFQKITAKLYDDVSQAKILYEKICKEHNKNPDELMTSLKITKKFDLSKAIKQGEKEFLKKNKNLTTNQKYLYEVMFLLIKSVCINLIELESFGKEYNEAYQAVLKLLNTMNYQSINEEKLKEHINNFVEVDYRLMKMLHDTQIENYGQTEPVEVSYSTRPHKAILVSGTNLKELELVLKATQGKDIDVYTHGAMILGHTFPGLNNYPHLRGQFGYGIENCLLDFATFPGAILMTKHALHNIEYLYRGRLFTTDDIAPKGVIKIENNDFEPLIKSALEAKGFAKGKERESVEVGYNEKDVISKIDDVIKKYKDKDIKHIFVVGFENYSPQQKEYFEKFFKLMPKDTFAISLSYDTEASNVLFINTCYDFSLIYKILDEFAKHIPLNELNITVFLTKCDKHTVSNMLNLKLLGIEDIYLCKCSPTMVNPALINSFGDLFGIKQSTEPKKDMEEIMSRDKKD